MQQWTEHLINMVGFQMVQMFISVAQSCKFDWLSLNMENIEQGRPIEFIRHRRETQGYAKVKNDDSRYYGAEYSIQRVDNGQIVE